MLLPVQITFTAPGVTCTGQNSFTVTVPSGGSNKLDVTGQWNPKCDSSFQFYTDNNPQSSTPAPTTGYGAYLHGLPMQLCNLIQA